MIALDDDIQLKEKIKECRSLVGKLGADRTIGMDIVKNIMSRIWKINKPPSFKSIGRNMYIITFNTEVDKYNVLLGRAWLFD